MADKVGIKETKELALGAIALGFYLTKLMKDGFQPSDIVAFTTKLGSDPVFAEKLQAAYDGVAAVGSEIKDIDVTEGFELAVAIVPAVIAEVQQAG